MSDITNNFTIPNELIKYYNISDNTLENITSLSSNIAIVRDNNGKITSLKFYSPENDLIKILHYKSSKIAEINYYRQNLLYSSDKYNNELLVERIVYKRNGNIAYTTKFEYNKESRINRICKRTNNREFLIGYRYDSFGRITEKHVSFNGKLTCKQVYRYDILDRIVEYNDVNQRILVNKISSNNELISYTITDKMGNIIDVENHFADCGYICTNLTVNGHATTVNDTSYVDNIMLKKPYATEDDLDIIISNLFTGSESITHRSDIELSDNSMNAIEKSLEIRTLPISLRKRALYNTLVKRA